jgi:hypothetical protein
MAVQIEPGPQIHFFVRLDNPSFDALKFECPTIQFFSQKVEEDTEKVASLIEFLGATEFLSSEFFLIHARDCQEK